MRRSYYFGTLFVALSCAVMSIAFVRTRMVSPPATASMQAERFEVERITLQQWGFEPKAINRPPGPFSLIFENRSGFGDVDISLTQESGPFLRKVQVTKNALTWKQRLELPPGTYLIKESSRPDWQCRITIGNNN